VNIEQSYRKKIDRYKYHENYLPIQNMGKKLMNQKNILSLLVVGIMLISITGLNIQTVKAQPPIHAVKGILYVNGEIYNSNPIEVKIDMNGSIFNETTFPFDGEFNYNVGTNETGWGDISVFYSGKYRIPEDNSTVYIHEGDPVEILLDIHIVTPANNPPNKPSLVSPSNGSKVSDATKATLKVKVTDPDGDTMDVSFYNANGDVLIGTSTGKSNGSNAKITWSGLTVDTSYNWYAIVTDGEYSIQSDTWSFTTGSSGPGPGPTPPPPSPPGPANTKPVADASAGEPYSAFLGEEITFDGSDSTDEDGTIMNYTWDFGDGSMGYGINPTYTYDTEGTYTVILTVTDDDGATDTDETTVEIKSANIPPSPPEINGTTVGKTNNTYEFTVMSTDFDNDSLSYIFDWGDGETDETAFAPHGQNVTQSHTWITPGEYTITVTASDSIATSQFTEFTITIEQEKEETKQQDDWTWLYLLIIIIIILLILYYLFTRGKKPEESKQPENKPKKQPPKKKGKK
jgi:PKD repeat protein